MKGFKYCIWAVPESGNEWYNYTNGFYPHITIKKNLSLDEAFLYFETRIFKKTEITLKGDFISSFNNGFSVLYIKVDHEDKKPDWWPEDAHVSFCYKYNEPFTNQLLEYYSKNIPRKKTLINKFILVRCDGDFINWKNQIVSSYYNRYVF
jgi:hypothetical protein